jgi:O-antigen ligase
LTNDLYIWFLFGILTIVGIYLVYLWHIKFEIALFFFALSPLISAIFFDNLPQDNLMMAEDTVTVGVGGLLRASTLGLLGIIGIAKFLLNIRQNKLKIPIHLFLLGVFILFSLLSAFYSLDINFTIIRAGLLFAVFGFLLGLNEWLQEEGNIKKALDTLFILIIILMIITLISLIVIPSRVWWWKAERLIGLWEQPNSYGAFTMLCYPILFWKFYTISNNKKYYVLIPIIINVGLHILTGSRTTIIASSVGVLIWFLLEKNWLKLFSVSVILGLFIVILLNFSPSSFERVEDSNLTNFSSRDEIWNSALVFVKDRPWTGYGFGVEGKIFQNELKIDLEDSFIESNVRQAMHNGYLSILVGGGVVALIFWIIILLLPLGLSLSTQFSPEKAYAIFTIIAVLITNFLESALTGYSHPTDIFFWLAWIILGAIWTNKNKLI